MPLLMDRMWDLKSVKEQVLYLAPSFTKFVTLDKLLKMSEPQVPSLSVKWPTC